MKIGFIGFGNMAKAIAKALKNNPQYQLYAASPSLPSGKIDDIITDSDNANIASIADILILAVKPAHMDEVLQEIRSVIKKDCLVISIASGKTLAFISEQLQASQPLIRCMPNMAIAWQKGAIPMIANHLVSPKQKHQANNLFESSGLTIWLNEESDIDVFTALSGSGPAYIFYFLEAMQEAAIQLGLEKKIAHTFALQTLSGAVRILEEGQLAPETARLAITSKGGTTEAAISVFEHQHLKDIVHKAMDAAFNRAKQLGK